MRRGLRLCGSRCRRSSGWRSGLPTTSRPRRCATSSGPRPARRLAFNPGRRMEIMAQASTTIEHDAIRKWAEDRGGAPARVKGTEDGSGEGILRFDFAEPDDKLEKI